MADEPKYPLSPKNSGTGIIPSLLALPVQIKTEVDVQVDILNAKARVKILEADAIVRAGLLR